jgi:hypothetical protein
LVITQQEPDDFAQELERAGFLGTKHFPDVSVLSNESKARERAILVTVQNRVRFWTI